MISRLGGDRWRLQQPKQESWPAGAADPPLGRTLAARDASALPLTRVPQEVVGVLVEDLPLGVLQAGGGGGQAARLLPAQQARDPAWDSPGIGRANSSGGPGSPTSSYSVHRRGMGERRDARGPAVASGSRKAAAHCGCSQAGGNRRPGHPF